MVHSNDADFDAFLASAGAVPSEQGRPPQDGRLGGYGALRPEVAAVAVPSTSHCGGSMTGGNFALTAGWGHFGQSKAVMPGRGGEIATLGEAMFDIYLNGRAYCRNRPSAVLTYKLGGRQVLKEWLSYRGAPSRLGSVPPSATSPDSNRRQGSPLLWLDLSIPFERYLRTC